MLLVIRPFAGWVSLIGVKRPKLELAIIAFFGIRGLGSLYLSELRLQPRDLPVEKSEAAPPGPYAPPSMQVRPSRPAERPLRRIRREASPPAGRIFSEVTPLGPLGGTRRSAAPPRFGCPGEYGRNDPRQPFAILGRADFALHPPFPGFVERRLRVTAIVRQLLRFSPVLTATAWRCARCQICIAPE
jgi:hypothetical protein